MVMKLQPAEAISYLKDCGYKTSRTTYFRYKKKVESLKWQRLIHAANLFTDQHLQRLDKLELIEELMWKNYLEERSPFKKVGILKEIVSMQPYLSNYYGATTFVLSKRLKTDMIETPAQSNFELKEKSERDLSHEEQKELRRMTPLS